MYSFDSIFTLFRAFNNRWLPDSVDKWGRPNEKRQRETHDFNNDKNGDGLPDVFVRPERKPSLVRNYTDHLKNTSVNEKYKNSKARKRAYAGYSTGTIFSSGVSRLGQLAGLFDQAQQDPLGQRSYSWA